MRNQTSQILFDYWNSVRDGRIAPQRIEIDPSALSKILSQTMILEVVDTNTVLFRIAGTGICEFLASEMRGRNFMELWAETDRRNLKSALNESLTAGSPMTASIVSSARDDLSHNSEILLLPLQDHKGQLTRLLGSWSRNNNNTNARLVDHPAQGHCLATITNHWPSAAPEPRDLTETSPSAHPPATLFSSLGMRIVRRERRQFGVLDGGLTD